MPVSVKRIVLWRGRISDRPGALASQLEDLDSPKPGSRIVMAYGEPGGNGEALLELWPPPRKSSAAAGMRQGLAPSGLPTVLVQGGDRRGFFEEIAGALAAAGINIAFLVHQSLGRRFSAVFGFENDADATRAMRVLRNAVRARGPEY